MKSYSIYEQTNGRGNKMYRVYVWYWHIFWKPYYDYDHGYVIDQLSTAQAIVAKLKAKDEAIRVSRQESKIIESKRVG